jgi:hypothetical protein
MEAVKDIVKNIMQELETKKTKPRDDPCLLLKKVLTKKELGHIKFNYFRKGILNVSVDSSTWLYHLNLQKKHLLGRLIKESGAVKDIRFRIGEIE